jgi:hypothetical protein
MTTTMWSFFVPILPGQVFIWPGFVIQGEVMTTPPTCGMCDRERTLQDDYEYSPLQVLSGRPFGWYSGDDGEVCGDCMTKTIRGQ